MKKLIILLSALLILTSCVTEKKCNRKYPPQFVVIEKDTVIYKEKIVIKDSIINVILPNDTVILTKYLTINKGIVNLDTIIKEQGIVGAMAFVNNNELGVVAYISDSTIFYKLDSAQIRVDKYKEALHSRNETRVRDVVRNSAFAGFTIWWFWITAILIAFLLYLKIK